MTKSPDIAGLVAELREAVKATRPNGYIKDGERWMVNGDGSHFRLLDVAPDLEREAIAKDPQHKAFNRLLTVANLMDQAANTLEALTPSRSTEAGEVTLSQKDTKLVAALCEVHPETVIKLTWSIKTEERCGFIAASELACYLATPTHGVVTVTDEMVERLYEALPSDVSSRLPKSLWALALTAALTQPHTGEK